MKSFRQLMGGYTITELMVVLVISTGIFTMAIAGYNQQNTRTQFAQAVREMELSVTDVLNDVGTGYYPNSNNFSCSASPSRPVINAPIEGQGKNQDCIFVGRAVDLTSAQNDFTYEIYTIAGLRNDTGTGEAVDSLNSSRNIAINGIDGAVEVRTIKGSINIAKTVVGDGSTNGPQSAGFAIVTGFGGSSVSGSGATTNQVSIASINNSNYTTNDNIRVVHNSNLNDNVLTICIEETGGDGRHATITIGKGSSLIDVDTKIDNWPIGCQ